MDAANHAANREERLSQFRDYHAEHKDRHREVMKAWNEANREKVSAYNVAKRSGPDGDQLRERRRQHYRDNKARYVAQARTREVRTKRAVAPWASLEAITAFYVEAERLTRETGIIHHVDHVIPLRGRNVCGLHVETNLQILPAVENLRKGNRLLPDLAA